MQESGSPNRDELFRLLIEQAGDAVIFADRNGTIRLWNSGAEAIFGFSAAEVLNKSLDVIIPDHLRSAHWTGFRRAMHEGRTKYERVSLTTHACHKTKPKLYIDLTFSIIKSSTGDVIGAQASARDVTERYLAERALREGAMSLGFMTLDAGWKVTFLNREAERTLGKESLAGRNLWEEFPDLIGSPLYERIYLSAAEQTPAHFESYVPPLNAWLEAHVYPSPSGVAVYLRNINRAKYLEEELARSEQMLRLLVDQARDYAIVMYDVQGSIRSWNTGAERLYQYRRDEILSHRFSELGVGEEAAGEWPTGIFKKALEQGSAEEESWRRRKDGSRFLANVNVTSLRDEKGRLQGFSTVTRDTTERHNSDLERARLLKEAQDAVASRDELLSIASHEIKTPLTAISLQLQMLHRVASKHITDPVLKMIVSCERQSERLSRLLDELLDVTRIRLGKLKLDLQETDLSEIASDAVERFSLDAERAGSKITTRFAAKGTGIWDPGRLEEIANNLISNAIKYGGGNPIEVRTTFDERTGTASLIVKDQGIGIPSDMLGSIFGRFERVDMGKRIKGVGLGLYVVRQLVEAHQGTITVQSEPGRGSTFVVALPIRSLEQGHGAGSALKTG